MGHSETGVQPSQERTSFSRDFRMESRLLIFPSMSAIFASVRLRISELVVRRDIRNANSSRISLSEKPSS